MEVLTLSRKPYTISILTRSRMRAAVTMALIALTCMASTASAATERQYKLEAAFLYNFFNYINWPGYSAPQGLTEPVVCVEGNDPVIRYLEYVQQKLTDRQLHIRNTEDTRSAEGCHILFIRSAAGREMAQRARSALESHTVVVATAMDLLDYGGTITITPSGERMAVEINQTLLQRHGFQVSSRLLELARRVK